MGLIESFDFFIDHTLKNISHIKPYNIKFYHLILVLEGTCTYVVNNEKIVLEKNDALLLVPGTLRERYSASGYNHIVILNFYTSNDKISSNYFFKNRVDKRIKKLLDIYPYKTYKNIGNKNPEEDYEIRFPIQNLFECILFELFESLNYQTQNPHILNALKYIDDNITRQISLNSICQVTHLSKEYLCRLFKKEMNITIQEYINDKKLNLAKNMLSNNDITIQEISRTLGYENYSYFSKAFKRHFHISPQKMRKEMKYIY